MTPTARARPGAREPIAELRTPADVLYQNEIERSRTFAIIVGVAAACGIVGAILLDVERWARLTLGIGCGAMLGVAIYGVNYLRDPSRYDRHLAAAFGCACVAAMVPAYLAFGWASAVGLLVPIGGITWAMGQEDPAVWAMAFAAIGSHALVGGLQIAGVLPARGAEDHAIAFAGVPLLLAIEASFGASFWLGRQLRGQVLGAVARYGEAMRDRARQAAVLEEVLADLDAARRPGDEGRRTGTALGGFRLGVLIGHGAMGEVYEAVHVETNIPAAVKVLSPLGAPGEQAAVRFAREIKIAASLRSPHIVRVLDHAADGDPVPFLAMERLHGVALGDHLHRVTRMPFGEALEMLHQVALGVDAAHEAGIVHRDLKPSNLFRHVDDRALSWKVLDFGVSRHVDDGGTLTGQALIGTPQYMAPEQVRGERVDPLADVFSLGAIAYRALTGQPAFGGADLAEVLHAVANAMPDRPSSLAPLPGDVDLVLALALAKDRTDRFGCASALALALAHAAEGALDAALRARAHAVLARHPWRSALSRA